MRQLTPFFAGLHPALSLTACVILVGGSCPPISSTLDNWTQSVKEARDDFRVNDPDACSKLVQRVRVPFGWRLESQPRCGERIRLQHFNGARAIVWEQRSGTGRTVHWHVTFRRDEMDCVATGGFSYAAERLDGLCIEPAVRIYGPKSRLVRHIFVRWPATEKLRLEEALQTKTAPGICTR